METYQRGAGKARREHQLRYVHLGEGTTPTSSIGVAVEPRRRSYFNGFYPLVTLDSDILVVRRPRPRRVAMGPGGGCGVDVAGRKEPVLSLPLAGALASSCAAQVRWRMWSALAAQRTAPRSRTTVEQPGEQAKARSPRLHGCSTVY